MGEHFQIWSPDAYRADMAGIDDWRAGLAEDEDPFAVLDAMDREGRHDDGPGRAARPRPARAAPPRPSPRCGASGSTAPSAPAATPAGLLDAGAARVIGVDRDPEALDARRRLGRRLRRTGSTSSTAPSAPSTASPPRPGTPALDGVVLDIGVSSMQLDQAARGFSFQKDGPLDMRMSQAGPSPPTSSTACPRRALADLIYQYGEERASRRIARAIVADRRRAPFATTLAARRPDRAPAAGPEARPAPSRHPQLPGAAHRGQRRARRARPRPRRRRARARPRRLARGRHLPLARGPHRQALPPAPLRRRPPRAAATPPRPQPRRPASRSSPARRSSLTPPSSRLNPRARSAKLRVARRLDAPAGPVDRPPRSARPRSPSERRPCPAPEHGCTLFHTRLPGSSRFPAGFCSISKGMTPPRRRPGNA